MHDLRVLMCGVQLGGVYADIDVQCLKPIDDWNADHAHDAAVLLGVENFEESRPERIHVVNWVLASVPGHPLLSLLPGIVARTVQQQYFEAARLKHGITGEQYEKGVLDRTGPAALTRAMYQYFQSVGSNLSSIVYENVTSEGGLIAGDVRVLPIDRFGSGWQVANARSTGANFTCDQLLQHSPSALVCHMFWGSWRSKWSFRQQQTYGTC
jgi:mannosyltransferase OCH1-like enzyme